MARPSSYPRELRERAVRMVMESKGDYPSEFEAILRDFLTGLASPDTAVDLSPPHPIVQRFRRPDPQLRRGRPSTRTSVGGRTPPRRKAEAALRIRWPDAAR